jgi:hypothetical protein
MKSCSRGDPRMAIKPIDLQALVSPDGQGRQGAAALKEGAVLHQSIHGAVIQKQQDEAAKSVRRAEDDELQPRISRPMPMLLQGVREANSTGKSPAKRSPARKRSRTPHLVGI